MAPGLPLPFYPCRVSPEEQRIIELTPNPPRTIILLGRSGTGAGIHP